MVAGATVAQAQKLPKTIQPDVRLDELPRPEEPKPPADVLIPETAPTRAPAGADEVKFVLSNLEIDGVTVYAPEVLEAFYKDKLGTEVSLGDVYGIADAIQMKYREDGYFLTRVIVPPQTIRDGQFRLQVFEGNVDSFRFEGNIGPAQKLVASYLENIVQEQPLKLETLERYLLLANDIPGVNVMGVLSPSAEHVGSAQLVANISRKPFDALFVVDNYGDEFTGNTQIATSLSSNAQTSLGERITFTGLWTDPMNGFSGNRNEKVAQLNTSWRLGRSGFYTNALVSYGNSKPGFTAEELQFNSNTWLVSVVGGYPVIRSRSLSAFVEVGFDFENSNTDSGFLRDATGNDTFSRDKFRTLHLTGRGEFRDSWRGTSIVRASIRQGLPIFDATESGDDHKTRADGTSVATVLRGSASRLQGLVDGLDVLGSPASVNLFANAAGQYAFKDVLSDDEFDVGMSRFGRGYDQSELNADHGIGVTTELQFNHKPARALMDSYQLFAFFDYGRVWNRGKGSEGDTNDICSSGFGARAFPIPNITLEAQFAKPICKRSRRSSDGRDPQFLFRAIARY